MARYGNASHEVFVAVATDTTLSVIPVTVRCDACNANPIRGPRYNCMNCYNYDLCESCYEDGAHDLSHRFQKILSPGSPGVPQPPRSTTGMGLQLEYTEVTIIGINPSALEDTENRGTRNRLPQITAGDGVERTHNTNETQRGRSSRYKANNLDNMETPCFCCCNIL